MATSKTYQRDATGTRRVYEVATLDSTFALLSSAPTNVACIKYDNTLNSGAVTIKLYNTASPTVGTTTPEMYITIPAAKKNDIVFDPPVVFATALSVAATTESGTGGTTNPPQAFHADIVIED